MTKEVLEDGPIENEEKGNWCPLCIDSIGCSFVGHTETPRHIYNYILQYYNLHKKSKAKDRHGIEMRVKAAPHKVVYSNANGTARTLLDIDAKGAKYVFNVKNVSKNPILLTKAWLLHPYQVFHLDYDVSKTATPLMKGDSRSITVNFKVSGIGFFDVPVCFGFHKSGQEFLIIKTMAIEVTRDLTGNHKNTDEENEASPFTGESWGRMDGIIQMEGQVSEPLGYVIPPEYKKIFRHKLTLQGWDDITDVQLQDLNTMLASLPGMMGYGEGLKRTHNHFFHCMLWLDEYHTAANLHKYNMKKVPMRLVVNNLVELEVPGLAEKRPSVIKGDILYVRVKYDDGSYELEGYEGQISKVNENTVWIKGFHYSLLNRLHEADMRQTKMLFDVRFTLGRWPMYVQHLALDNTLQDGNMDVIFPEERETMKPLVSNNNYKYYNKEISSSQNAEQMTAVDNIVKGSSRPAPYIVFGPPGTGKTVTIVESILQIKSLFRASYVLVCAPSNSACDHIVQLLKGHCSTQELLRLTSRTRDWELVPKDIRAYTNAPEQPLPNMDDLKKYRIIVCTLIGAARFSKNKDYHFTHVFIDEAGQAVEPEALVAVGGILGPVNPTHPGGQLILAGDPKQLGPVCSSKLAENFGLGMSLLQRLMLHCPLYQRGKDGNYNERYFTKLLDNYRSHPTLLEIPNKQFYDGELRAKCGREVLHDPLCTARVLNANGPLVFHGVIGHERKEGKSPSFFNELEIDTVMQYVKTLLDPGFVPTVSQSDIGVIAPYIRQVYKLKRSFESRGWDDIEVGTTETFQGREKRVILISTVRANRNLLDYDRNFKLGFLISEKRFNVAVTRARCLLIVIGCPHVLEIDKHWKELIAAGTRQGSNVGCATYDIRSDRWTTEVIDRVSQASKDEKEEKKEGTVPNNNKKK